MMLRSIRAQLRSIREQLTGFAREESAPDVLIVRGGLPGGSTHAIANGHIWHRKDDEGEDDFESRVVADARRLGVPVTIKPAGLPQIYKLTPEERAHRFRFVPVPDENDERRPEVSTF